MLNSAALPRMEAGPGLSTDHDHWPLGISQSLTQAGMLGALGHAARGGGAGHDDSAHVGRPLLALAQLPL